LAGPAIITIAIASPANNDNPSIIMLILTSAHADLRNRSYSARSQVDFTSARRDARI